MTWSCLVPGCQANPMPSIKKGRERITVFQFPLDKKKQLEIWIKNIPLDFRRYSISKKTRICEKHFEDHYKIKGDSGKYVALTSNAIPTIFEEDTEEERNSSPDLPDPNNSNCSFCWNSLQNIRIEIDEDIESKYENLTQIPLTSQKSQHICFNCNRGLTFSFWFKSKLIKQHQKLLKTFSELDDDFHENKRSSSVKLEEEETERMTIKEEKDMLGSDEYDTMFDMQMQVKEEPLDEDVQDSYQDFDCSGQFQDETDEHEPDFNIAKYLETQTRYPSDGEHSEKQLKKGRGRKAAKISKWRNESVLCQDCGKIMRHASLQLHIDRKHRGLKGDFVCDLCGYRTHTKNILKYHMTVHSKVKNYKCKECDRWFPTPGSVISHHKNIHRKDEPPKYFCQYCNKAFRIRHKMVDHVRAVHLKERRYACTVEGCGQTFTVRTTYYHHKNEHDGITFNCPECPSKFYLKKKLKEHMNRHTRPFRCETCGAGFHSRPLLEHHQKSVHQGIKEFQCSSCPAAYSRKIYLDRHIMSFHMNLKLSCEIPGCKSMFARKETYKNHVRSHHKDLGEENMAAMLLKIRNMKMEAENLVVAK